MYFNAAQNSVACNVIITSPSSIHYRSIPSILHLYIRNFRSQSLKTHILFFEGPSVYQKLSCRQVSNMQLSWSLSSNLSRFGKCHTDEDKEARSLLKGEEKEENWKVGWIQTTTYNGVKLKKKNARSIKHRIRKFCNKIPILSSLLSLVKRKGTPILSLGDSALGEIYQYRPIVDKACFALSCKRLYGLFSASLKQAEFEFPRLLKIRIPILCVNSHFVARNKLLLRLESPSWLYCGRCLKLHPRKEFDQVSLSRPVLGKMVYKNRWYPGPVPLRCLDNSRTRSCRQTPPVTCYTFLCPLRLFQIRS